MPDDIYVHKFGEAALTDASAIRHIGGIVQSLEQEKIVLVIPAMGNMTNALERLTTAHFESAIDTNSMFDEIKTFHYNIGRELFGNANAILTTLNDLFVEIDWILEEEVQDPYDYLYDQIVSIGELLSTRIVCAHLQDIGILSHWLDARDVLKTDNSYRSAQVDGEVSEKLINDLLPEIFSENRVVVTQGSIGCTSENLTSTLGRKGSNNTADIFARALGSPPPTIWKDSE